MQLENCLFCKIQRKEIPGYIIYEDSVCYAMMDLYPAAYGHILVIPNSHFDNYMETDPIILAHLMKIAQKVAHAQEKIYGNEGNKLVINCKEAGNQKIFHTHIHVLPHYFDNSKISSETLEIQANKMKEAMK